MTENIKEILDDYKEETKRHFDVVTKDIKSKIETVSEQVATNTEQITAIQDTLAGHDKKFESIESTLEVIKLDIEFIKNELKQIINVFNSNFCCFYFPIFQPTKILAPLEAKLSNGVMS